MLSDPFLPRRRSLSTPHGISDPAVPFKAKAACRRHIPKQQHRVTNWAAYDAALRARGSLTVWFTPEAIAAWGLGGSAAHQPGRAGLLLRSGDRHDADPAGGVPLGAAPDRRADRLHPPAARSRSRRAGPLDPEPPGRDTEATEASVWPRLRAGAPAGGQHGAEVLRPGRVADGEARHQAAPGLESAASRDRRRYRPDRCLGADRQGCR